MKKCFLQIVVLFFSATVFAQSTTKRVATLSHEGTITAFSGINALINAVEAAADGDIITLSSGHFNGAVNIDKSLTIRGAGKEPNPQNGTQTTYVVGDCKLGTKKDSNNLLNGLRMEGLFFDGVTTLGYLDNTQFSKCHFSNLKSSQYYYSTASFTHCRVILKNTTELYKQKELSFVNCDVSFDNTYGTCIGSWESNTDEFNFQNCFVWLNDYTSSFRCCNFSNSILHGNAGDTQGLNSNNSVDHSLIINASGRDLLRNLSSKVGCYEVASEEGIWEPQSYLMLTAEAKAQYKGSDGTEVGLYGGPAPYDPFVKSPRITKFNVAQKTTIDGKLSVDIAVEGLND